MCGKSDSTFVRWNPAELVDLSRDSQISLRDSSKHNMHRNACHGGDGFAIDLRCRVFDLPIMTKVLSTYIDFLRILLASWVVLGHMHSRGLVKLPQGDWIAANGHEAVLLFFVMSGLVVAASAQDRHHSLSSYLVARCSRIYVVAVPALLITLGLDLLTLEQFPAARQSAHYPAWQYDNPLSHLGLHLAFLGQSWQWHVTPFSNLPYWSLTYEFWFYLLYGVVRYQAGWKRWVSIVAALALAGPRIVLLFPCWALGVGVARLHSRIMMSSMTGLLCFVGGIGLMVLCYTLGLDRWLDDLASRPYGGLEASPWGFSRWFLGDLLISACFMLTLLGLDQIELEVPEGAAQLAKGMASISFALYLIHDPIVKLLTLAGLATGTWLVTVLVAFSTVLCAAWILTWTTERYRMRLAQRMHDALRLAVRLMPAGLAGAR